MRRLPLLCLLAGVAHAQGPTGPFPDCAPDNRAACPNDLSWTDTSWLPDGSVDTVRAAERALGSGVSLDVALRTTSGRWDVTVAVIDSGIDWTDAQTAGKVRINLDEARAPQRADGSDVPDWDLDGNGIINVWDWAEDARVSWDAGVDAADDRLDPSDLIATFSDGVDDDGNGYVDDLAGWDFFEHDNDPYAGFGQGFYDHGTGVAQTATAWADDRGDLGGCPDCSLLPVRIGEAFVTDGDRVALALAYIAENNVASASLAIGSLSLPDTARAAARHAADQGVVLVAAAGDENAWHRNVPAGDAPFLFVKSIRADGRNEGGGAQTYMATWNCNNFGPRLDLVAPSSACATGATAKIAGLAALVHSAGRDQGVSLTAEQVRALLRSTADDVAFSDEDRAATGVLPASPGWDAFHGHGRANVGAAVQAVIAGQLPPTTRLDGPDWFSWSRDGRVQVRGEATSDWVIEIGVGAQPSDWQRVAQGSAGPIDRPLDLPMADVTWPDLAKTDTLLQRFERAHQPLVQIRLRSDNAPLAESRTAVWVHDDPDLLPGFPVPLGGSSEGGANLADIDGDGVFEVIVATASGQVRVLDGTGTPVAGWDGHSTSLHRHRPGAGAWSGLDTLHEGLIGTPAVGDLDGDGTPEIVVAGLAGGIYVLREGGMEPIALLDLPETPLPARFAWDAGVIGSPVIVDLDPDEPGQHILVGDGAQRVWLFEPDGTPVEGYPLRVCHPEVCGVSGARIVAPPAVGDIDGDGDLDAVIATGEVPDGVAGVVHLVDLESATLLDTIERFGLLNDTLLPVIGEGHPTPVALADLDGDGDLELASTAMLSPDGPIHHTGEDALVVGFGADAHGGLSTLDAGPSVSMANAPAMGDIDGDGVPDLVVGAASLDYIFSLALTRYSEHQHGLFAWSGATGEALRGFPRQVDGPGFLTAPAIADVTGDGRPEVLATSSGHLVYANDADGALARGFPHFHGGWAMGGPSVGDIDGDGLLEVVVTTRDGLVFAWRTDGPADGVVPWPRPRHDPANTGSLATANPVQDGPREGCGGCNSLAPATIPAVLAFALLFALGRRRS